MNNAEEEREVVVVVGVAEGGLHIHVALQRVGF